MQDLLFVVLGIIQESWAIEIENIEEQVIVEDMDRRARAHMLAETSNRRKADIGSKAVWHTSVTSEGDVDDDTVEDRG